MSRRVPVTGLQLAGVMALLGLCAVLAVQALDGAGATTGAASAAAAGPVAGPASGEAVPAAGGAAPAPGGGASGGGAVPVGANGPGGLTEYQQQLAAQVQDAQGAPRTGRDPAAQRQVSLAEAAGAPAPRIVASASPAPSRAPVDPKAVLGDPRTSGVMSNGCALGYGRADQCVPARAGGGLPQTCANLVRTFPNGVIVSGTDVLGLDLDRSGIACDAGDLVAPGPDSHAGHGAP